MRRVVALLLVALVSATVPIGRGGVSAAEPEASSELQVVPPSPSASPAAPSDAPTVHTQADDPVLAPAALTPTVVYFSNLYPNVVVNTPLRIDVVMFPNPDGGTLSFQIDGVTIDSAPADSSTIRFLWTPTHTGQVTVTGSYSGTATLASGVSEPSIVDVIPPYPTVVDVSATPNHFARNTTTPLVATVTPDPGPGTVEFKIDNVVVTSAPLVGGTATANTSISVNGQHSLVAVFTGNADWSARSSDIFTLIVTGDAMTLGLIVPGDIASGPVTVMANLTADPGGGTVDWGFDANQLSHSVAVGPGGLTALDLGTLAPGAYHLYARFMGFDTWAPAEADAWVKVNVASATVLSTDRTTGTVGELPVKLTATVDVPIEVGATVTFVDDVGGVKVDLATVPVDPYTKSATYSSNALRIGTHTIRARFNGMNGTLPSTSDPVTVVVSADKAVHATFTTSLTSFYPYKDLFKDTVSLGGVLDEKATITVKIYNSAGSLKRTFSLGTKTGRYSVSWNGRTASGAVLPAGRYTAKASFKDLRGNVRTMAVTTSMNWKQAVWKSGSVVRYGDQFTYYADVPDGRLFYSPDYSRGRTMMSDYIYRDCAPTCAWISGLTNFTLNTTALGYRSIYIQMQGHGYVDYNTCDAWLIRPGTGAWEYPSGLPEYLDTTNYHIVVASAYISSTHKLDLALYCSEAMGQAWDVHYLKLTYLYAVWK